MIDDILTPCNSRNSLLQSITTIMPPKSKSQKQADKSQPLQHSTQKTKRQIRDLTRQLEHSRDKLPSNVIVEKERKLAALNTQLQVLQHQQKVSELTKKYKMVRFLEWKKVKRAYKSADKKVKSLDAQLEAEEDEDKKKELKKELKKLRKVLGHCAVDVAYVGNFPYDKKYMSLYPKEMTADMDENVKKGMLKTERERQAMKKQFEQKIKDGTLRLSVEDILNGKKDTSIVSKVIDYEDPDAAQEVEEAEDEDEFFE